MLMDMCLPRFDSYQATVASNYFKSHANPRFPIIFSKKELFSDVQSEIHIARRNIVSAGQSVRA